jgi:hypothetical protein
MNFLRVFAAVGTAAKDAEGMPFDGKIGLVLKRGQLLPGKADIYFDHAMAICAGQVMMMIAAADPIMARPVSKLDAVEQARAEKHFDRAVDSCAPKARLNLAQLLPQSIGREIGPTGGERFQSFRDKLAWAGATLSHLVECYTYLILDPHARSPSFRLPHLAS